MDVDVAFRAELDRSVASPAKPGSIARLVVSNRPQPPQRLALAGVEGRVDVDEIDRFVRQRAEHGQVVAQHDPPDRSAQNVDAATHAREVNRRAVSRYFG